jgi:hypothetical protein
MVCRLLCQKDWGKIPWQKFSITLLPSPSIFCSLVGYLPLQIAVEKRKVVTELFSPIRATYPLLNYIRVRLAPTPNAYT